jgi:hypothetical protein
MYNDTCAFVYTSCAIKYDPNSKKEFSKNSIRHIGYGAAIVSRLSQNELVI